MDFKKGSWCKGLPLVFKHAPLLLGYFVGLVKRKATLNPF